MACVKCFTFNQSTYIKETLDSFCMQNTTFPYVCCIFDDASTDGEPAVISNYLQENFDLEDNSVVRNEETDEYLLTFARHKNNINCFFAVLYLKYNHYSIKKAKNPYISEWQNNSRYIALCEGDDYWTDCLKLQKQFDYMELHPECSMCFHSNYRLYSDGKMVEHHPRRVKDYYDPRDVLLEGGGMLATSSVFFRSCFQLLDVDRPVFWKISPFGDVPFRLYLSTKGLIGYIPETMSVYRKNANESWTRKTINVRSRISVAKSQQKTLNEFDKYTEFKYHKYVICGNLLNWMRCIKMILMILKSKL